MKTLLQPLILILLFPAYACWCQDTKTDSLHHDMPLQSTPSVDKVRKDTRTLKERISLGGSTGFWIQPRQTHLEVSGLLAYHFPKILSVGPGYRYIFTRNRVYGKNLDSYGPNAFARAQLTKRIYFWTEWEYLKTEYAIEVANNEIATQSTHVDSFYAGLGYIRQIGRRKHGGFSFQLLYNFLYEREDYSPYYSPVIYRVGYFF